MTVNVERRLERLLDRIESSADISHEDREALLAFNREMKLLQSTYGDNRRHKLLDHCMRLSENVGSLADALDEKEAAEDLVLYIHDNYPNEESNRDYRTALRIFGKRVTEGENTPESLDWISSTHSKDYDPAPDPTEMLSWEKHIQPMLEEARHPREKALIAVAWDSGARSGEITDLTVGDITDHKYGLSITVDGKTGQRSIMLIPSVPYLRQWLNVHPAPDNSEAPLWCKLDEPRDVSYQMKLKMLKKPARKAGVNHTSITFTRMRKSSASHLASQGVSQAHLEDHHGWTRGSDVAARYISVFADANDREIARAHGLDVDADDPDPIAPLTCPRCSRETPREEPCCVWCGQAVDHEAVETIREDQREKRTELLRLAQEDPELLEALERMESFIDLAGSDPSLLADAQAFVEASVD